MNSIKQKLPFLAVWLLFLLGTLYPEPLWGVHFLSFFSFPVQLLVLGLTLLMILIPSPDQFETRLGKAGVLDKNFVIIMPLTGLLILWALPTVYDVYGDAPRFLDAFARESGQEMAGIRIAKFLSPNIFHLNNGELTVLNGMEWWIKSTGLAPPEAFRWLGIICGTGMFFIAAWWLRSSIDSPSRRLILAMVILSAPVLANFTGHVEIYAPHILVSLGFWYAFDRAMKKKGFKRVILPGILLFLAIKTHTIGILYVPAWIFLVLSSGGQIQAKFTWKKAFIFIFVPFVLAGLVVYFFILRDHMDPRFLDGNTPVGERLFLPMFSPSPPLDRYNLFSWNHILDYFNIWLFLSPGAIAMILYLFMARPEGKKLQDPALILTGTTFALFLIFFFGINPLLGMPMDWDLFSLIFPVMISFLIVLTSKLNLVSQSLTPVMPVLAISLLGFLFLPLNASKSKTGERLQALGKHGFKTYWIHSAAVIFDGVQPWEDNPEEHYQRLSGITDDLLPWANEGNDIEFAELLRVQGRLCRRKLHQYDEAVKHQEQALTYAPDDPKFNLGLMEAYYLQGNLEDALKQARILIREGYPSQEEALRIGMDIALEGRRFEDALIFGREYTRSWQDNPAINKVVYLLRNNQRLDDLSRIFRGQME